ncbi:Alkaline ceramidase 3 [Terramyces sp. JEL0728]|nr:Alkaline ceramidase 3 [Terramyces sp. JEL0728]
MSLTNYSPYWSPPTASVNWCENDYEHSSYLAEYFNSLSSFAMAIVGFLGIYLHPWVESRFKVAFWNVVAVGLGSVAFHGTLSKVTQAFDEVPMLWSALTFAYILICQKYNLNSSKKQILVSVLFGHAAITTYLVTAYEGEWQFRLFHLSFESTIVFVVYQLAWLYRKHKIASNDNEFTRIFERGCIYLGLAILCWVLDFTACRYLNPSYSTSLLPFNPQLHSFWHLLVSLSLYYMAIFGLYDRMQSKLSSGYYPSVKYLVNIFPYIVLVPVTFEKK